MAHVAPQGHDAIKRRTVNPTTCFSDLLVLTKLYPSQGFTPVLSALFSRHPLVHVNMVDRMDVDEDLPNSSTLPEQPPDPLLLLRQSLPPFINSYLIHSLGEEFLSHFAPPPNATLPSLLKFLLDKWLSVFQQTPLSPHKSSIQSLHKLSLDLNADPDTLSTLAQRLLIAIGRSSLAAKSVSKQPVPAVFNLSLNLVSGVPRQLGFLQSVVLDGSNIAWRHSNSARFSIRGVAEAVHYFSTRGHPTVLVLPEARLDGVERYHEDEAPFLHAIRNLGDAFVATPETEYDDAYICDLARRNAAVIVSNDRFKDHVYQMQAVGGQAAKEWSLWFESCRLGFTFRGDNFIPNPAFNWEKAASVAGKFRLAP